MRTFDRIGRQNSAKRTASNSSSSINRNKIQKINPDSIDNINLNTNSSKKSIRENDSECESYHSNPSHIFPSTFTKIRSNTQDRNLEKQLNAKAFGNVNVSLTSTVKKMKTTADGQLRAAGNSALERENSSSSTSRSAILKKMKTMADGRTSGISTTVEGESNTSPSATSKKSKTVADGKQLGASDATSSVEQNSSNSPSATSKPPPKKTRTRCKMKKPTKPLVQPFVEAEATKLVAKSYYKCCSRAGEYGCLQGAFMMEVCELGESTTVPNIKKAVNFIKYCRASTVNKSKQELDNFCKDAFIKSIIKVTTKNKSQNESASKSNVGDDPLTVEVQMKAENYISDNKLSHRFNILYDNRIITLCRNNWCDVYGIKRGHLQTLSLHTKEASNYRPPIGIIKSYDDRTYGLTKTTLDQVIDIYEANNISYDIESIQAGLTRRVQSHQLTVRWFQEHFKLNGDSQPNRREIHLEFQEKIDIHKVYAKEMMALYDDESYILSYDNWLNIWTHIFPFVKIRVYKNVTGKCWVCYWITDIRQKSEDHAVHQACKELFCLHRTGLFMPERFSYKKRVEDAIKHSNSKMSIILDGMDQNHSKIPQQGGTNQFPKKITQHITGCLVHGYGSEKRLSLYRNYDNVLKGSNLSIHIIMSEINKWRSLHKGYWPKVLYVQMDGGPENANKYVLAALEYLVSLRYIKRIVFSRLPTGHTHEDIDACFGVIWEWFKGKIIDTPQEYKSGIEKALKFSRIPAKVEDIYIVPDYNSFFREAIDKKFSKAHKKLHTQHQWIFEAVERSQYFPNGCKTRYKAYSNDQVVEIVKKHKSQCKTPLGILTGLEPMTVHTKWYPSPNCIPGRPVEGEYILTYLPKIDVNNRLNNDLIIPPASFQEGSATLFSDVYSEVTNHFHIGGSDEEVTKRSLWIHFFEHYAPSSDDVMDYYNKFPNYYKIPLETIYYGIESNPTWNFCNTSNSTPVDTNFKWPTLVAVANPSVQTQFNPHPPPPRTVISNQEITVSDILESDISLRYRKDLELYSRLVFSKLKILDLKEILKRKVSHSGKMEVLSTTKAELINQVNVHTFDTAELRFRKLLKAESTRVTSVLKPAVDLNSVICKIYGNSYCVRREHILQLRNTVELGLEIIHAVTLLFAQRDEIQNKTIAEKNKNFIRKPSLFLSNNSLPIEFLDALHNTNSKLNFDYSSQSELGISFPPDMFEKYHRIYIIFRRDTNYNYIQNNYDDDGDNNNNNDEVFSTWGLIIIDFSMKKISYFDPRYDYGMDKESDSAITANTGLKFISEFFNYLFQKASPENFDSREWKFVLKNNWKNDSNTPTHESVSNLTDCGIYTIWAADFDYNDVPILFRNEDVQIMRKMTCHYLLTNQYPL